MQDRGNDLFAETSRAQARHGRALVALLTILLPAVPLSAEPLATLERMRKAAVNLPGVVSASVNRSELLLIVTTSDGTEYALSPDNLDRTLDTLDDVAAQDAAIVDFVSQVSAAMTSSSDLSEASVQFVLPVVTSSELALAPAASDMELWTVEIAPGLSEYLVLDAPSSVAYVTEKMILDSGFDAAVLRDQARTNLRKRAADLEVEVYSEAPWVAGVLLDGFYECSLMLLPEVWSTLAEDRGGIVAACPARGELLAVSAADQKGRDMLQGYSREAVAAHPYPGSDRLYQWSQSGWTVLP